MKPKKTISLNPQIHSMKKSLRRHGLHTVCEEAKCPNLGECFSRGTAAFMILGSVCTRSCKFCSVKNMEHGTWNMPSPLPPLKKGGGGGFIPLPDPDEPKSIARMVHELKLKHVVITSVTRDDLPDEGASQFAATVFAVRNVIPAEAGISLHQLDSRFRGNDRVTIEVLTPDFHAREDCLKIVCEAGTDIYNHNIETVRRLTPLVRSHAEYERSLNVLRWVNKNYPTIILKSGLMVGLGETREEVLETLKDLCSAGCKVVTIGQYLAPSKAKLPIASLITKEAFNEFKVIGEGFGITSVFSGTFVRSSYMADTQISNSKIKMTKGAQNLNDKFGI